MKPRRRRVPEDARDLITPELIAWAGKKAGRYILRYGDADGLFEPLAVEGLMTAAATHDEGRGGFDAHARRCVIQSLNGHLRRIGPLGYRRDQDIPGNHLGAPVRFSIDAEGDDELESRGAGPIGWEIEYEDFVESLASRVPAPEARVLRLLYLECEGGTFGRAGLCLGKAPGSVKQWHDAAIRRIRARLGVDERETARAAGQIVRAIVDGTERRASA